VGSGIARARARQARARRTSPSSPPSVAGSALAGTALAKYFSQSMPRTVPMPDGSSIFTIFPPRITMSIVPPGDSGSRDGRSAATLRRSNVPHRLALCSWWSL
jgi:hypothetical protein